MAGPDPENKRKVSPHGDPGGSPSEFPIQHDLGAKDPFEGSEHAPATRNLDPLDIRLRPFPQSSTDTYPDEPASLGFDK